MQSNKSDSDKTDKFDYGLIKSETKIQESKF